MSSSSGQGVTNNQLASTSTSSAEQPDDSTTHNENSNKQSTSQAPQHRPVNNERDAGASTSYNLAETQVTQHSLQDPLTLMDMGEQHQLILDAQTSALSATYVCSPEQLPTDDGTSILCNLDFPQATTPQLFTDLEDILKTELMRLQPIGVPNESHSKPHPCPSCNVVCGDLEGLRRHAEVHDYKFTCFVCDKRFLHNELLLAHVGWAHPSSGAIGQRDEDNGLFPCDECELVYANAEARERHAEEHTLYRGLTCSSCNKRFALNEHLAAHACTSGVADAENQHARTDLGTCVLRFGCTRCGARFPLKDLLERHMRAHEHLERRERRRDGVMCGICDLECPDEEALKRHMTTHTPKLMCLICGQKFESDENLTAHVLIDHPPEEENAPFVQALAAGCSGVATTTRRTSEAKQFGGDETLICRWPGCGKTFAHTVNLTRHMKIHTNEKQFVCRFCGRAFMRSDTRARHVRLKHKDAAEDEDGEDQL